ncbi:MAG: nuclear transport factor 2 family protein [Lyngbya sp.]|nr:nuclear transport factor 2 family protein [Lyngbya sp.]
MYHSISSLNVSNKELIISLFETIDSSDWKLLVNHFDKDIIYERPGYSVIIGIDKLLHFYQQERVIAFGKHQIEHIVCEDKFGSCWGQFIGTHKNGSPINESFSDVYSFEQNKIITRRSYFFRPAI